MNSFHQEVKLLIRRHELINDKIGRNEGSELFNHTCLKEKMRHTHTHTHIYIYIYISALKCTSVQYFFICSNLVCTSLIVTFPLYSIAFSLFIQQEEWPFLFMSKINRMKVCYSTYFKQILEAAPHKTAAVPPISKTIQVKRTRHEGHCWRSKDKIISVVFLWTSWHWSTRTYLHQLCADIGCSLEDLPGAMDNRDREREREREREGERERERERKRSQGNLCKQRDLMMMN